MVCESTTVGALGLKMAMRAHVFQHVSFEGLGSIAGWLTAAGWTISGTRFYDDPTLPKLDEVDFLVVMGGPMSVNDEARRPWLAQEKRFIRQAIEGGKPVLGICLGAQLIARALGARVYPNREKEIGWFPVQGVASARGELFQFPEAMEVFHWHGETFDLPPGAVHLARSEGCENQAFQLGRSVIGLQFHLETTPEGARELVENCREELRPARFVQTETEILASGGEKYRAINGVMARVLAYLCG